MANLEIEGSNMKSRTWIVIVGAVVAGSLLALGLGPLLESGHVTLLGAFSAIAAGLQIYFFAAEYVG